MATEQGSLFDPPRVSAREENLDQDESVARDAEGRWGALGARYSDYRGKTRKLCDDCTARIHKSKSGAHPSPATKRRKGPNGELLLCNQDAADRYVLDQRAERTHGERLKAVEHQRRGRG